MITGIGTDIIEIPRIQNALDRHGDRFLEKIFTLKEQEYCLTHRQAAPHFAGRFAAKEAVVKALGGGEIISWSEIEILNNEQGKPEVFLSERLMELFPTTRILISISHCESHATATALLVKDEG